MSKLAAFLNDGDQKLIIIGCAGTESARRLSLWVRADPSRCCRSLDLCAWVWRRDYVAGDGLVHLRCGVDLQLAAGVPADERLNAFGDPNLRSREHWQLLV